LHALSADLRLPSQITNPRACAQLLKVKSQIARTHHLQRRWPAAAAAWTDFLLATGVHASALRQQKHFDRHHVAPNHQFLVTAALYSLGVACHFQGNPVATRHYIKLAEEDPAHQAVPPGKLDYTAWYHTVRAEYAAAVGRRWWSGTAFRRALCGGGPEEDDVLLSKVRFDSSSRVSVDFAA